MFGAETSKRNQAAGAKHCSLYDWEQRSLLFPLCVLKLDQNLFLFFVFVS